VLYNAALNPLGALRPLRPARGRPDTRAIMDQVIDEAFAVAPACGARTRGLRRWHRQVLCGRWVNRRPPTLHAKT
jgi:ketopantoate reductase